MSYSYDDSSQRLFDHQMRFFSKTIRYLFEAFLLSPLILTGYCIAYGGLYLVGMQKTLSLPILGSLIFSYLVYGFMFFLKGVMLALKTNQKSSGIPWYVLCLGITISLLLTFVYQAFLILIRNNPESVSELTLWEIFTGAIVAYLTYQKYKCLTDIAPKSVF